MSRPLVRPAGTLHIPLRRKERDDLFGLAATNLQRVGELANQQRECTEIIKTLHFDSDTGMPQYDPVARKVYVNLQDQDLFGVIDPVTDTVARYPVGRCGGNHGMTLDVEHHHTFLSCEGNTLMRIFDLGKHGPIAFLPMPDGPNVIKFDLGLSRIYVACHSGAISVFRQDDPSHYTKIEDFPVPHAVHTLTVDQQTLLVYAPEQEGDGQPVARMGSAKPQSVESRSAFAV